MCKRANRPLLLLSWELPGGLLMSRPIKGERKDDAPSMDEREKLSTSAFPPSIFPHDPFLFSLSLFQLHNKPLFLFCFLFSSFCCCHHHRERLDKHRARPAKQDYICHD